MTIKTYRTRELKGLSLHLFINSNVRTQIVFKGGCTLGSTATYTTADTEIQKAIEALPSFGSKFYIEKEQVIEEAAPKQKEVDVEKEVIHEEEPEVVDMLDARTFKNLVELRRALEDKGIDVSSLTNVKVAETIAKKNGYNYTVEKNA